MGSQKYEIGSFDDQIIFEDGVIGGDKLVLDASSSSTGSTTPADVSIILEIVYNLVVMDMTLHTLFLTQVQLDLQMKVVKLI